MTEMKNSALILPGQTFIFFRGKLQSMVVAILSLLMLNEYANAEQLRLNCKGSLVTLKDSKRSDFSNENTWVTVDTVSGIGSARDLPCYADLARDKICHEQLNFIVTEDALIATVRAESDTDTIRSTYAINRYTGELRVSEILRNKRSSPQWLLIVREGTLTCTRLTDRKF